MCDEKTFDDLIDLLEKSPEDFEEYRKAYINKQIERICGDCPERLERCKKFQWRLEQELRKYKDPLARYNAMIKMFWDQFSEFQQAVNLQQITAEAKQNADILQFPKNK